VKCVTPAHNDPGHGLNPDLLIWHFRECCTFLLLTCKVQLEELLKVKGMQDTLNKVRGAAKNNMVNNGEWFVQILPVQCLT